MARPKTPLISRRSALTAALSIMDTEGLDALSIRRLADELGVNGASLYHHFQNKDEILLGAARLGLSEVRTPEARDEDWHDWMARNAKRLRAALIQHPGLIPIIMNRGPLGIGTDMVESSATLLDKQGLPLGAIVPLLEALELFAISSAMQASRGDGLEDIPDLNHHDHPTLARAAAARDIGSEEVFDAVVMRIIEAVEGMSTKKPAGSRTRVPPAKKSTGRTVTGSAHSRQSA